MTYYLKGENHWNNSQFLNRNPRLYKEVVQHFSTGRKKGPANPEFCVIQKYAHHSKVKFLVLFLYFNKLKYSNRGKLGEGNMKPIFTHFATSCESVHISKFKKSLNQIQPQI